MGRKEMSAVEMLHLPTRSRLDDKGKPPLSSLATLMNLFEERGRRVSRAPARAIKVLTQPCGVRRTIGFRKPGVIEQRLP